MWSTTCAIAAAGRSERSGVHSDGRSGAGSASIAARSAIALMPCEEERKPCRYTTPTLTPFAAPKGEQFAPWDGPAALTTPTLTPFAAPKGEQFAPWDGPAAL